MKSIFVSKALQFNGQNRSFLNFRYKFDSCQGYYDSLFVNFLFSKFKNSKKNFDYYFYFGHSYSLIGNNKLAITLYDSAINIDYRNDLIFFERGFSNFVIGNSNQALKDVDKAIKITPNNPKYYVNRGSIKYDLGFVESACEDWNRAIELNSKIINYELIEINCN